MRPGNNAGDLSVPHLTGIRGIAILLVLLGHYFYRFYIFNIGWTGLNLFFILSGYLITSRLYHHLETDRGRYFVNFYMRRILRIFPLYYGCLVILFLVMPYVYDHYREYYAGLYHSQAWYWCYMSNWYMILHGIPKKPDLFHFWSLAIEEQFYLLWPLMFRFLRARLLITIMLCIVIVSIIVRIFTAVPEHAYFSTLNASEALLAGCLICIIEKENSLRNWRRLYGILAIISAAGLAFIFGLNSDLHISNTLLFKFGFTGIDILLSYMLYLSLLQSGSSVYLRKLLSAKWLLWLGRYSYGIYVFHWIFLQTIILKAETTLEGHLSADSIYFLTRFGGLAAVLLCSYASYHLYEKRFLNLKKYFG